MNLFLSTQRLASGALEDHLTEFLAAAIAMSLKFRREFAAILLGHHAGKHGWPKPEIADVDTQADFPGSGCVPDMMLTLADGKRVLVENKIEAIETVDKTQPDRGQIARYLKLPVDGVAYIRGSWRPPARSVLAGPKYIRPEGREHFLWRDFHAALRGGVFLDWMREGFERMGYTQPLPEVGDLRDPDEAARRRNCANFAKLWSLTRSSSAELGWSSTAGSVIELYMHNDGGGLSTDVFVSPAIAERFLVRVDPKRGREAEAEERIRSATAKMKRCPSVTARTIRRARGIAHVVDVESTMRDVLHGAKSTDGIERALWGHVGPLLKVLA